MLKISNIRCRKLYGHTDYFIDFKNVNSGHFNILYGDNGSGKTTILRLVYSLLSNNFEEGNKNFIARTPFESLQVELSDGSTIAADRMRNLVGQYTIIIVSSNKEIRTFDVNIDPDQKVSLDNSPSLLEYSNYINQYGIRISLITDDRFVLSSDTNLLKTRYARHTVPRVHFSYVDLENKDSSERKTRLDINRLYESANVEIKDLVIASTFTAQNSINQVYIDIAKRIASSSQQKDSKSGGISKLLSKLQKFEDEYLKYATFELLPNIEPENIRQILNDAPHDRKLAISEALSPLVENAVVRFEKLRPVLDSVSTFLSEMNRFLRGKTLQYTARRGFHIVDSRRQNLDWNWLSSGERQLLFLFGMIYINIDKNAIILIDEPEISLNVKWQRMFIDSIERVIRSTSGQFIVASHSIEIISGHIENVSELKFLEPLYDQA